MEKIGLIAGNRKFPIFVSENAKKKNYYIIAVGIKEQTLPGLRRYVDKLYWLELTEFPRLVQIFKSEGVKNIIMAGQISPYLLFDKKLSNNAEIKIILDSIKDKKADTIFGAIAQRLKEAGLELLDSTLFVKEFLPKRGTLTKREPNFSEWEDIYFGLDLAKMIAFLDIGQTVAVKQKAILAIEALEGTDSLIRRAGRLCGGGFVVVKVSKPQQDMRFDIPVIGLNTVKNLIKSKASCLALESEKTLFLDQEESIRLANRYDLCIIAV
ncbi:MAG: UDP-2,3-diacylglucosamine diphosphatase LpxI [Candidatus Omnitrophica bacterium]|nr:UDP-2,3-diacylglucosamine diphosphatase LpxI [Candidatus Omnitrophota bacterium]